MTAGTRRNGTSKFGPHRRASAARHGGPDRRAAQAYGTAVADRDDAGPADYDWDAYFDRYADQAYGRRLADEAYERLAADGYDEYPPVEAYEEYPADKRFAPGEGFAGHAGDVPETADAGPKPEQDRKAERYTGRHASPRGKTARKRRVGKVVPVAAAAVTLAAGTAAAYALGGGQPNPAQLNTALLRPAAAAAAVTPGTGKANAAASSVVKVTQAAASSSAAATAKPTASRKPAAATRSSAPATPSPAATPSQAATPSAAATTPVPTPAATTSQPTATAASTLSCNLNYGLLPQNVTAIVSFLLANGYSDNAAAGIAGNIYQESKGNPESIGTGGGGLIGWTPLPYGFVTGNVSADLQFQLKQILVYNQGWASYLPALNAAASPADAAYIYVTDFERAGIPAAATREAAADDVASACGI